MIAKSYTVRNSTFWWRSCLYYMGA